MLGMIAHTVVGLVYSTIGSPAGVFLLVDPALGGQSSFLALDLDGTELNFRDASASSVTISGGTSTSYFWAVSSPGWSDSDTVLVAIRTADPELTIEALNDDIPHGLGNARAAGVAEFRVTRSYVPHGETPRHESGVQHPLEGVSRRHGRHCVRPGACDEDAQAPRPRHGRAGKPRLHDHVRPPARRRLHRGQPVRGHGERQGSGNDLHDSPPGHRGPADGEPRGLPRLARRGGRSASGSRSAPGSRPARPTCAATRSR